MADGTPTSPTLSAPKAIETAYAGCRFRSRLEARWAVFFDNLRIPWDYEPQGFELPSGRYLPDFWLPTMRQWVEVKGSDSALDFDTLVEAAISHSGLPDGPDGELVADTSRAGLRLVILGPIPRLEPGCRPLHAGLSFWKGDVHYQSVWFSWHGRLQIDSDRRLIGNDSGDRWPVPLTFGGYMPWGERPDRMVMAAYQAARSARFEFGETPRRAS